MPISQITNFDINAPSPIDSRMVVTNTTQRNNILYKYHGLKVYQTIDNSSWVWDGSSWKIDGNGIYGGSGSLIGDTDVNFANFKLSWTNGTGKLSQYLTGTASYETSRYSIEYNNSSSGTLGPYIRFNRNDSDSIPGGIGFGAGVGGTLNEQFVIRGDGRVGVNSNPSTNFQVGSQSSHAPITINTGSTFSSIGFNWFDYSSTRQKFINNSKEAAEIYLSNNNTLSIRTSRQGSATMSDRIVISNNLVNIPGFFGASAASIGSIGSQSQLLLATSSVIYNNIQMDANTINFGGEIRYENINNNQYGTFVFYGGQTNFGTINRDPFTGATSTTRTLATFLGGINAKDDKNYGARYTIARMKLNVGFGGEGDLQPNFLFDIDDTMDKYKLLKMDPQWIWYGVTAAVGTSVIFRSTDAQNSNFNFIGGTFSGTRNILTLFSNAVRLERGRVLSFRTKGLPATQSAAGTTQLGSGGSFSINHTLLNMPYVGLSPSIIISPRFEIGGASSFTSNWGHLSYAFISSQSLSLGSTGTFSVVSSNPNDRRFVDWMIYYRDSASPRD